MTAKVLPLHTGTFRLRAFQATLDADAHQTRAAAAQTQDAERQRKATQFTAAEQRLLRAETTLRHRLDLLEQHFPAHCTTHPGVFTDDQLTSVLTCALISWNQARPFLLRQGWRQERLWVPMRALARHRMLWGSAERFEWMRAMVPQWWNDFNHPSRQADHLLQGIQILPERSPKVLLPT